MSDGVLVIDKPAGISSAKALNETKRRFGRKTKVGHAGTLDPFATGILLALVGDATRLSALAMALPKVYRATVRFGWQTDTLDPDGSVVAEADPGAEAPAGLADAAAALVGSIEQMPPAYSALKVDGRRAYDLARAGEAPALKSRIVQVYELVIEAVAWPRVEITVRCGQGTYIRSIARDLGAAVGLPASLEALRRTAIGPFDEAREEPFAPLTLTRAAGVSEIALERESAVRFVVGGIVPTEAPDADPCAVTFEGRLIGLGTVEAGVLRPRSVLSRARADLERLGL